MSHSARTRAIESGEQMVVGVNAYRETEPSPLTAGARLVLQVDESAEREGRAIALLRVWTRRLAFGRRHMLLPVKRGLLILWSPRMTTSFTHETGWPH